MPTFLAVDLSVFQVKRTVPHRLSTLRAQETVRVERLLQRIHTLLQYMDVKTSE